MKLIRNYFRVSFLRQMEYKLNFILLCIAVAPIHLVELVFSWAVVQHFGNIENWSFENIAFLYALFLTSYSIAQVFFRQFRYLDDMVIHGRLDIYLLRPKNIIFTLIFSELNVMEVFSQLTPSVVILLYIYLKYYRAGNIISALVLIQALIGGTMIISCIFILIGLTSFWTYRIGGIEEVFFTFKSYMNYPIAIYGREIQVFLSTVLPLAFINYYPVAYIAGYEKGILSFMTLPVGIVMCMITFVVWKCAIRRYASTGS